MPGDPVLGSQRVEGMSVVYTIGYEGVDIDCFVATLRTVGVTLLADVRAVAVSRKKGFSKNGLRERLSRSARERACRDFDHRLMARRSLDFYRRALLGSPHSSLSERCAVGTETVERPVLSMEGSGS